MIIVVHCIKIEIAKKAAGIIQFCYMKEKCSFPVRQNDNFLILFEKNLHIPMRVCIVPRRCPCCSSSLCVGSVS